jgi:hypothetical protein
MIRITTTTAAALFALAAFCAWGAVGSVISSFSWPNARNGYRDAAYVYSVASPNALRAYTVSGSLVRTVSLAGLVTPGDADHSVLGASHLAVLDGTSLLRHYVISTGSLTGSVAVPNRSGYAHIPGGGYVYYAGGSYVYRHTKAGSLVNSFPILGPYFGGIAATPAFKGASGEYVVVAVWAWGRDTDVGFVYTANGSTVATFDVPGTTHGIVCGPGYPASFGTTLWCNAEALGGGRWCYQLDLGNGTAVAPSSLGRVKAVFR